MPLQMDTLAPGESIQLYYFSSIDYDFLMQRPQQLYAAWSLMRSRTLDAWYVEPLGSRVRWKAKYSDPHIKRPRVSERFHRYGRRLLPTLSKWVLSRDLRIPSRSGATVVAILCSAAWEPLLEFEDFDLICYDYLDAIEVHASSDHYEAFRTQHRRLVERSNLIFVTADKLRHDIESIDASKRIITVSNGVDVDYFEQQRTKRNIREEYGLRAKVAGYVGAVFDWVDLDMLLAAAQALPEVHF